MNLRKISKFYSIDLIPDLKKWSEETGINIYVVGGACRDLLRNGADLMVTDVDFCVESQQGAKPVIEYLSNIKLDTGENKYTVNVINDFDNIGTMIVNLATQHGRLRKHEFAMTRREIYNGSVRRPERIEYATVQEDALRRDFCCNAVYYDIKTEKIIDPTGKGIHDAKAGILRTIKNPETSFREDPLRMLRGIRFWCTKRNYFKLEENTEKAIKWYPEYDQLSVDLIRPEFETLITWAARGIDPKSYLRSSDFIRYLHNHGLLKHIIPELEESWGFNQNSVHHSMNLTDHLLATLDWAQLTTREGIFGGYQIDVDVLSYAALLHDISKYQNFQLKADNTFSFHGHEITSGEMAENILLRLGYDKEFSCNVKKIIQCHMLLKPMWDKISKQYVASNKTTQSTWEKIHKRAGGFFNEVLALIDSDNNTHAPNSCRPNQVSQFRSKYSELNPANSMQRFYRKASMPELPDGEEIISALNLSKEEYPIIKQIKTVLEDIIPRQQNYPSMTKKDILNLYLGLFDKTYYIRINNKSIVNIEREPDIYAFAYNPFDVMNGLNNRLDVTDPFDRARIKKAFESNDPGLINAIELRDQVKSKITLDFNDEKVLIINTRKYPLIYMKYQLNKQVKESFKKIEEGIQELSTLPGLNYISIDYQDCDISGIVDFKQGDRIVII